MTSLEIHGLSKSYGNRAVLKDIHLTVPQGEFFVLLGPSGGGKSTLLRIFCGIEKADAGVITLAGRDITNLPPRERKVGMVFQDYGLYPHMNAYENIAYGLEARGMPKAEIEQRVMIAAQKLGITPLLKRVIVDLSGGEQQRVALARALAKDADLFLFDEPLSNLDPKLRVQARRDIIMVHREKNKPTLYVTHDQTEALASGDRIAIIANGRLQQVGSAEDLIQRPANLFVAGFIGAPAMNLFSASLAFDSAKDEYRAQISAEFNLPLSTQWNATLRAYNKEQLIVGIPPAAFVVAEDGVHGQIEAVEALIGEVIVNLSLPGGVSAAAVFQGMEDEFALGGTLHLGFDRDHLCLFDPDNELAFAKPE